MEQNMTDEKHQGVCYNCGDHLYADDNWTKGWRCPDCTEPLCDDCMVDDMNGLCGDCMADEDKDGWGDDDE